jgi:GTP-binding protein
MKIFSAEFIKSATKPEQFPDIEYPELAFMGRSNVGKSSLLNSIVFRKNLARISSTPGKTQQINFFIVDSKWSFADMPGFGYASASKEQRKEWESLNLKYLEKRKNLVLVCMLIDSRHEPLQRDLGLIEMFEMFERNYIIILTKSDKISKNLLDKRIKQFSELVSQCTHCLEILPYSSVKGTGRDAFIAIIKHELKIKNQ